MVLSLLSAEDPAEPAFGLFLFSSFLRFLLCGFIRGGRSLSVNELFSGLLLDSLLLSIDNLLLAHSCLLFLDFRFHLLLLAADCEAVCRWLL